MRRWRRSCKADGYAILSEFTREPPANVEAEPSPENEGESDGGPVKAQVVTRTGKSVSGKATSGEPAPINYSSDKTLEPDKEPLSCPPDESANEAKKREDGFREYRKGEFPEAFERLCAMSIKPVASLRFKRDCLAVWERRVAQGFSPEQIIDAYAAYAKSFWMRNGDDTTLAKNLARWLEGEGGLTAYSDEPIPPDLLDADGEPLNMVGLAQADPDFAKLWRRVETRRSVIRSQMAMGGALPPEEQVLAACEEDGPYKRYIAACEERHGRYLKVFELFRNPSRRLERAQGETLTTGAMPFGGRLS